MAASGPGDARDPHVRTALEWLRVGAALFCLALVGWLVLDRGHGGFEYVIALLSFVAGILGLPTLAKVIRRDGV